MSSDAARTGSDNAIRLSWRWAWAVIRHLVFWNAVLKFIYELNSIQGALRWIAAYLERLSERLHWLFTQALSVIEVVVSAYTQVLSWAFSLLPIRIPDVYHDVIVLGSIMLVPVIAAALKTFDRHAQERRVIGVELDFRQFALREADLETALQADTKMAWQDYSIPQPRMTPRAAGQRGGWERAAREIGAVRKWEASAQQHADNVAKSAQKFRTRHVDGAVAPDYPEMLKDAAPLRRTLNAVRERQALASIEVWIKSSPPLLPLPAEGDALRVKLKGIASPELDVAVRMITSHSQRIMRKVDDFGALLAISKHRLFSLRFGVGVALASILAVDAVFEYTRRGLDLEYLLSVGLVGVVTAIFLAVMLWLNRLGSELRRRLPDIAASVHIVEMTYWDRADNVLMFALPRALEKMLKQLGGPSAQPHSDPLGRIAATG